MAPIVIIGSGMAACTVARELRKLDRSAPLMLVTGDAGMAYAKPMLSNAFALGKDAAQLASATPGQLAASLNALVLTDTRVERIDRDARCIETARGRFSYGRLVLATGAQPVRLPLQGDAAGAVLSVNHLDDYAVLRARLDKVGRGAAVVIIGAGLIGCEFAEDLAGAGYRVTLVDPNARPLAALASPALSNALLRAWSGRGVGLRHGTTAVAVERDGERLKVRLADGAVLGADVVLSAVGLRPSIGLAQDARLETRRGIVVDAHGHTSALDIFALGDCAEYATNGGGVVLPFVAPLMAAARAVAGALADKPAPMALKPEPVIVKTPSCKLALMPPPAGTAGAWHSAEDGQRIVSRFVDDGGIVRGFGLSQHTPALRQALLAEL
ncbi:MAG TPA: FAD-dependent oxidoreductase, partial [Telluria sp.]|nr:FAD-dependent oxidoreductase [Telluria sp.]